MTFKSVYSSIFHKDNNNNIYDGMLPLYSYIIQLVSLVSIAYLASSFWLPETQILLWTTALLILLNYSLSLSNLFRQGSITVNLIIHFRQKLSGILIEAMFICN